MKKIIILFAANLICASAWAYYDVLDTGEIMKPGKFKATSDVQLLTDRGGGNVGGIFDMGFQEEFGMRALAGFGRTDYFVGGLFKWMPIPDVDNQPAIGFNAGLLYGKWYDARNLTMRFEPLVSKRFVLETVTLTPYASLPIGIRTRNSDTQNTDTEVPFQLVVGSQIQVPQWQNLQFMAEIGLNLNQALSHISLAAIWYFDENGFELK